MKDNQLKKHRFWLDTETTGLMALQNQLLEYAVIVEDEQGNELERCEAKIRLKPSVRPEPAALETNKIDPYSDDWISEAITEQEAAQNLFDLAKKYTSEGHKPILSAYNAPFDKGHIAAMLQRYQINFDDCFNKNMTDPYSTAKRLVDEGIIQTRTVRRKNGKEAKSVKLEHVAEALKLQSADAAHRALADTETLIRVTREMYRLVTNRSIYEAQSNPHTYEPTKIVSIISDSQSAGFKLRPLMVLLNKVEEKKFLALDLADYQKVGLFASNLKWIEYDQVFDEIETEEKIKNEIKDVYESNLDYYTDRTK